MKRDLTTLKAIIKADYDRHVKKFSKIEPTKDHVFIGDSIVAYFPLSTYALTENTHNLGIPGDTTSGVLRRVHQVIALKPKQVILHIGLNDEVLLNNTTDETINSIKTIINEIKKSLTTSKIIVVSLTPINPTDFPYSTYVIDRKPAFAIKVNEALSQLKNITYINLYDQLLDENQMLDKRFSTDGIHLNQAGYDIYKNLLTKVL